MAVPEESWTLVARLGEGGAGNVYGAVFNGVGGLEKRVALKVLRKDAPALGTLTDEARVLGSLDHHTITRVDRLVTLEGRLSLVMEWVDGVDLETILQAEGPFARRIALRIVAQAARGLAAAARKDLLHRDIKPANLMVTRDGAVKILDFGLALAVPPAPGMVCGTFAYLSPELRAGEERTSAADAYALGCVLFELLTGEVFGPANPAQHLHEEQVAQAMDILGQEGSEPAVVLLCGSMLHPDPEERPDFQDIAARADELADNFFGESLADWATRAVLPLADERASATTIPPTEQRVLRERATAAPTRPARLGWAVVVSLLLIVLLPLVAAVGALGGFVGARYDAGPEAAAPAAALPPPVPIAPTPTLQDAQPTGLVVVKGADGVDLIAADGTSYAPGDAPPGAYTIKARWGKKTVKAGSVTLKAGRKVLLKCERLRKRCRVK